MKKEDILKEINNILGSEDNKIERLLQLKDKLTIDVLKEDTKSNKKAALNALLKINKKVKNDKLKKAIPYQDQIALTDSFIIVAFSKDLYEGIPTFTEEEHPIKLDYILNGDYKHCFSQEEKKNFLDTLSTINGRYKVYKSLGKNVSEEDKWKQYRSIKVSYDIKDYDGFYHITDKFFDIEYLKLINDILSGEDNNTINIYSNRVSIKIISKNFTILLMTLRDNNR